MITLTLVVIGTDNPMHLTFQSIDALNQSDLILTPRKAPGKDDLAELSLSICNQILQPDGPMIHEFVMPERDPAIANYAINNTSTVFAGGIGLEPWGFSIFGQ